MANSLSVNTDCMITHVLFDLSNVLLRWLPDKAVKAAVDDPDSYALVKQGIFCHADWMAFAAGKLSQDNFMQRANDRTGLSEGELNRLLDATANLAMPPLREGIQLLESAVKMGVSCHFLANLPRPIFERMQHRPMWQYFDSGVISADFGRLKPDPKLFDQARSTCSLSPQSTLFIDNSHTNVINAVALGFHTEIFRADSVCYERIKHRLEHTLQCS